MDEKNAEQTGEAQDQVDNSKRNIVAVLLGGLGVAALSACTNQVGASEGERETIGRVLQAASGTKVRWVSWIGTAPGGQNNQNIRDLAGDTHGEVMITEGFWRDGDGGGGVFFWDIDTNEQDDGGTIIREPAWSGVWKRIFSGPLNVRWFGAVGDGTDHKGDGSYDTSFIQQCLLVVGNPGFANHPGHVHFPAGNYRTNALTLYHHRLRITGDGPLYTSLAALSPGSIFKLDCSLGGLTFDGINFRYDNAASYVFDLRRTQDSGFGLSLSMVNCTFDDLAGVFDFSCGYGSIGGSTFERCRFTNTPIRVSSFDPNNCLTFVKCTFTGITSNTPAVGIECTNTQGCHTNVQFYGCVWDGNYHSAVYLGRVISVLFSGCYWELNASQWDVPMVDLRYSGYTRGLHFHSCFVSAAGVGKTFVGVSDTSQGSLFYGVQFSQLMFACGATIDYSKLPDFSLYGNVDTASAVSRLTVSGLPTGATSPIAKPTVTGSAGDNIALQNLLTALSNLGIITYSP